ncbi:MAG TPA: hypothetical protein PKV86_05595, partial [Syntrophobacteraceae bacterium]|nr:hypothetical protein [Syntrophobacteraceae bacterium]
MTQITSSLQRLFENSRIVFWIDPEKEWSSRFEAIDLPGIEKVRLANQEFGFKRRALRLEPIKKFLVYRDQPIQDEGNWLLDMELGFAAFRADPVSLWMLEVGLDTSFRDLVKAYPSFFKDDSLREGLKDRLHPDDTESVVREKMVAACLRVAEPGLEPCCEVLFKELAQERDALHERLAKAGLDGAFWKWVEQRFGYKPESSVPTVLDLCLKLFKEASEVGLGETPKLRSDALVFLRRFRDNRKTMDSFRKLSDRMAKLLGIEHKVQQTHWKQLLEHDWFHLVDQKILVDLVSALIRGELHSDVCQEVARKRRSSLWYEDLATSYQALEHA